MARNWVGQKDEKTRCLCLAGFVLEVTNTEDHFMCRTTAGVIGKYFQRLFILAQCLPLTAA